MNDPKGNLLFLRSMWTKRDANIPLVSRKTCGREQVKEVQNKLNETGESEPVFHMISASARLPRKELL